MTDEEAQQLRRDYAICLQRAIEHHCQGMTVPREIGVNCPHHAQMLDDDLARHRTQEDGQ